MALTQTQVSQLYVSIFGRASEGDGNTYWQTDQADIVSTANVMLATDAASTYFGSSLDTDAAFVAHIYTNTLGKAYADDPDGQDYWVAELAAGKSRGEMVAALITAAQATENAGNAQDQFNNKVAVSDYCADNIATFTDSATFTAYISSVTYDSSTVTAAQTTIDADVPVSGTTFTLTTAADTIIGTSDNDLVTGTSSTFGTNDVVIDQSSTDNDTMNVTLTTTNAVATVSGIEKVNFDWDAFGTAGVDAASITGATITVTSSKLGFLGSATVSNAGANTIVAGSGADGTLTVTGATTSTVTGGEATAISVAAAGTASADDTLTLTAGTNTTSVTVADFDSATVDAGTATTISLTDDDAAADDGDTVALTFGADATLTNNVDDLTVTASAAGLTLTVDTVDASLDFAGTNSVTLNVDDATDLDAETVTNSSTGTLALTIDDIDGAADLDEVEADTITVAAATAGGALTVATGSSVTISADLASAYGLTVAGTGTTDTATLTLEDDQSSIITFSGIETTTIAASATVSASAVDLTIAEINAGTNDVVLTGANDVTITLCEAGDLDATALTNDLIVTQDAAADMDITGGTIDNTVVFKGTTHDNNYVGQSGDDTVTFATTTGSATAVVGAGDNTITANTVTTGDLVVVAGSGDDVVSATALTTGNVTLELGDGANDVTLDGTFAGINMTLVTGSGADTLTIDDGAGADTFNLTFGSGTDTLEISEDITAGTFTVSGLEVIAVGSAAATAVVNSTLLTGKSYSVTAAGTATDTLLVQMDAAASVDFSNITIDQTITKGLAGLEVTGSAGNDTIVLTDYADVIAATGGGDDTITGGNGSDDITLGAGDDTVIVASGDAGTTSTTIDFVSAFTSGADTFKLGVAGSATNYAEVDMSAAAASDYADALGAANTALDGTVIYAVIENSLDTGTGWDGTANAMLFIDFDADGTADAGIELTGALGANIAYTDIIA
ncbi:MAG: DUF4214 domain-containing protein [Desulfobulbaceae bacterium]|nr:DUF4214 domain-containing protein [Desulfobulbaceae bacterium]